MQKCLWWTLLAALACASAEYLMGGHLDNNARAKPRSGMIESPSTSGRKTHLDGLDLDLIAEESTVGAVAAASSALTDDDAPPPYHIPYPFAFNGGKPFSLEKDPITGKIDFEKAPPVRILNYTDRYQENKGSEIGPEEIGDGKDARLEREKTKGKDNEDVGPNEINTYTSNFHDFFNLPIHYSSDKYGNDKYPLISSSYANTKVQSGANSYSTYNHRPYHPENDLYSTRRPYASMAKTSTQKTTTVNHFKTRWISTTSPSTITATSSTTTNPPKTMPSTTTTKAPVITTWKPPAAPITLRTSDDRTVAKAEDERKNAPAMEESQGVGYVEAYDKNSHNVPTQSPNDKTTEKLQAAIHYGDQSNLNNYVLAQDTKSPSGQAEEYRDSYDTYESPDGENEDETDKEDGGDSLEGDSEENDYFLSYPDLSYGHVTLAEPAITPSATTSTAATITSTIAVSSSTSSSSLSSEVTSVTTARPLIKPLETVSSTPLTLQQDVSASNPPHRYPMTPQHPSASSQTNSDRGPNVAGYYDSVISHEYRPSLMTMSERDKMGSGIVMESNPSTSNIVIPPGQDTVSFVLGNHQNVGGSYYSVGTAIGESPYGTLSDVDASFWPLRDNLHGPVKEIRHEHPSVPIAESNADYRITHKWRLPSSSAILQDNNENLEPARVEPQGSFAAASIAVVGDTKNRSEEQHFSHVTFPQAEAKDKNAMGEDTAGMHVANEMDGDIRELTPGAATTMGTVMTKNQLTVDPSTANAGGDDLPELAENLMPPAENSRPPTSYYYQYQQHDTERLRPGHPRPQRLPLPARNKPHSGPLVSPLDMGSRRRPYSPDAKLPNILPQFRPNAKASHGHRFGSDVIGTMLAGQNSPGTRIRQPLQSHQTSRRPFPPPSPSYLQRLNPPPPPIHAVRLAFVPTSKTDSLAPPHETEPTIRRFRPPHISLEENGLASSNRLLGRDTRGQHESEDDGGEVDSNSESEKRDRGKNKVAGERESEDTERYPEEPPMTPPRPPLFPKRRTADSPRVTTLQMIQHHGEYGEDEDHSLAQSMESVLVHRVTAERRKSDSHDTSEVVEQPVYVVYPVNSAVNIHSDDPKEKDGSVVVGTRGPHRPLPPDTLLQNERQKVQSVYNPPRSVALDFPYPLERPDPSSMFSTDGIKETPLLIPNEQRQQTSLAAVNERESEKKTEQDAINVIPYLQDFLPYQRKNNAAISVTLHRATSMSTSTAAPTSTSTSTSTLTPASTSTSISPIAYVYSPTRAAAHSTHRVNDETNVDSVDVTATVLLPSQQPSSSSSSAPAPQNFMAPFVASMSAEGPSKNGWSVVVVEPSEADRRLDSDSDDSKSVNPTIDMQTDKIEFDADNFRPQLFGGFKPIYEFPMEDTEHRDVVDTNTETDIGKRSEELRVT